MGRGRDNNGRLPEVKPSVFKIPGHVAEFDFCGFESFHPPREFDFSVDECFSRAKKSFPG
jgi:hypothetical protein